MNPVRKPDTCIKFAANQDRASNLQIALAGATQTNKKTAEVSLDRLGVLAYKEIKNSGEFLLPGFGKLVKQKRKARTGSNPKTRQKIKIPAKTMVKFRVANGAKDTILGALRPLLGHPNKGRARSSANCPYGMKCPWNNTVGIIGLHRGGKSIVNAPLSKKLPGRKPKTKIDFPADAVALLGPIADPFPRP